MKSETEIRIAHEKLTAAARYAERHGDHESYETCANVAVALGWVLENGGHETAGVEELLKGAKWASDGGTERN